MIIFFSFTPLSIKYFLYISSNKYDLPHLLIPVITFGKPFSFDSISLFKYTFLSIILIASFVEFYIFFEKCSPYSLYASKRTSLSGLNRFGVFVKNTMLMTKPINPPLRNCKCTCKRPGYHARPFCYPCSSQLSSVTHPVKARICSPDTGIRNNPFRLTGTGYRIPRESSRCIGYRDTRCQGS